MRLILLPLLATAASALAAPAPPPTPFATASDQAACADRLTQVRDAADQPRLDRSPAIPGQGYLIAAVDKRIDGCAVMQMHRQIDDLRRLPQPTIGPAQLQPAR